MHRKLQSLIIITLLSVMATACKTNYDHSALMGGTSGGGSTPGGGCGGLVVNDGWNRPVSIHDNFGPASDGIVLPPNRSAMDSSGNAVIVWHQVIGSGSFVFKSEYRNGVWMHPAGINDYINQAGGYASSPSIAMNDDGQAVIAYLGDDGSDDTMVFKSEYRNGVWTEPMDLDDHLSLNHVNSAAAPQVSIDNSGNAVIVWLQAAYYGNQIYKAELRNGIWQGPIDIYDAVSLDESNAYNPWVAMNDQGKALISWHR